MTLPNFFVIGAAKAGTTSLYLYLKQHPQVYMSPLKEPRFFSFEGEALDWRGPGDSPLMEETVRSLSDYAALFRGVTTEPAIGEASPAYLSVPGTAARIHRRLPEARLIAVLRDPVERAYSGFLQRVSMGQEPCQDFLAAVAAEPQRIAAGWAYRWWQVQRGFYYEQLRPYVHLFGRDRLHVVLYEDWKADNVAVLQGILRFLGVDDTFVPNIRKWSNRNGRVRSRWLGRALAEPSRLRALWQRAGLPEAQRRRLVATLVRLNHRPTAVPRAARRQLVPVFREDILQLQRLIGRDLSAWLTC